MYDGTDVGRVRFRRDAKVKRGEGALDDEFMICEGAALACSTRRDALCFVRFMLEQMSVPEYLCQAPSVAE